MRNGKEMLWVSQVYFYQHDDTDFTELFLSHTEGTESTNGKVKTENGKRVWMILLAIILEDRSSQLCCWNLIRKLV